MTTKQAVLVLKNRLDKATSAGEGEKVLDLLNQLQSEVLPTKELLKDTKIGYSVGTLKNSTLPGVSALSKEIVQEWRKMTGVTRTRREQDARSASPPILPTPTPSPTETRTTPFSFDTPAPLPSGLVGGARAFSASPSPPFDEQNDRKRRRLSPSVSPPPRPKPSESKKPARSWKTDGIVFDYGKGSEAEKVMTVRAKCSELLYDALATESDAASSRIRKVTSAIEQEAWNALVRDDDDCASKAYKDKMRQLHLSLKQPAGAAWRVKVVNKEVSPSKLVGMDGRAFVSEEQKEEHSKTLASVLKSVVVSTVPDHGAYKDEQAWHSKGR